MLYHFRFLFYACSAYRSTRQRNLNTAFHSIYVNRDVYTKRWASRRICGRLWGLRREVLEAANGGELLGVHGVQHRWYGLRRPFAAQGRRYHCRIVPETRTACSDLYLLIMFYLSARTSINWSVVRRNSGLMFCSAYVRVAVCWWQGSVDAHRHFRHILEQQEAGSYWLRSHHIGGVGSQQLVILKKPEPWKTGSSNVLYYDKIWIRK